MVQVQIGSGSLRHPFRFPYKSRLVTRRGKAWCVGRRCFRSKEEAFEFIDWHY